MGKKKKSTTSKKEVTKKIDVEIIQEEDLKKNKDKEEKEIIKNIKTNQQIILYEDLR